MTQLSEHQQYLLLGKLAGNLNPDEMIEFEKLILESQEAQSAFHHLSDQLPADQINDSFAYIKDPLFWKDLTGHYRNKRKNQSIRKIIYYMSAAAVIVALSFGIWIYMSPSETKTIANASKKNISSKIELRLASGQVITLDDKSKNIQTDSATLTNDNKSLSYKVSGANLKGMNAVIVPAGMDYKINLSDGSEVWMNSETRLDFPFTFSEKERVISLSGEAYVKVKKDKKKPFIVQLAGKKVEVLGTEFNVNSYDSSSVKVSLVTGSVNIEGGAQSLILKPGQQAQYSINSSSIYQKEFDEKSVLSWMHGLFYLDDAKLPEIIKVINRWFGKKAVIDNPALEKKKFVGAIDKNQDLNSLLDDLRTISKIESYFDKDGTLHFK